MRTGEREKEKGRKKKKRKSGRVEEMGDGRFPTSFGTKPYEVTLKPNGPQVRGIRGADKKRKRKKGKKKKGSSAL